MEKLDIKIKFAIDLIEYYEFLHPEGSGDKQFKVHGLKSPFKEKLFDVFKTHKDKMEYNNVVRYADLRNTGQKKSGILFEIKLIEADLQKFNFITNLLVDLKKLGTSIQQIEVETSTSKTNTFAKRFLPSLFAQYKGNIPIRELINSTFSQVYTSIINQFNSDLENDLWSKQIASTISTNSTLIIN